MQLFNFQKQVLSDTEKFNRVAYFMEMGTGKTFVGGEKLKLLNSRVNIVICQKSKMKDWIDHFKYNGYDYELYDLTNKKQYSVFFNDCLPKRIGFINYELAFRRKELLNLKDFTLLLDESSMIQNDSAKRTKFILKMKPKNVILLSGTPVNGKYENLYSQIRLLGWKISKELFYNHYIETVWRELDTGVLIKQVIGYKNVDRLKTKLRDNGAIFLTTKDAKIDLPEVNNIHSYVSCIPEYNKFLKDCIIKIDEDELVGDNTLTKMLYARMLCGSYNKNKLQALRDLLQSSNDRFIIFYNFNKELHAIEDLCIELDKPTSIVNGEIKDLRCYEEFENSVTLIQYQAGAMGLNLQKCNKTIYFTLPLSSELFEQSKARTHRIGQDNICFYYHLICEKSIEEKILFTLQMRKDYTNELFRSDYVQM